MVYAPRVPPLSPGQVVRRAAIVLVGFLLAPLIPVIGAQSSSADAPKGFGDDEALELYPSPVTANAASVQSLFNGITWVALAIFVFVEGLLLYVIWRFRHNKTVPKGETHRGHTKAEVFWTIGPAVILVIIGAASVDTMEATDKLPETDFEVRVVASQFSWRFVYPDDSSTDTVTAGGMFVEEGKKVELNVTAVDVIHAVWIPSMAIKIDAVPGKFNHVWFQAPAPGTYFMQCAEFCGRGHHAMRGAVNVFPAGTRDVPYGAPPAEDPTTKIPADVTVPVDLGDFFIKPTTITVEKGKGVHVVAKNVGKADHNFAVPEFAARTKLQPSGTEAKTAFLAETAGEFEYVCEVPGHKEAGMVGKLIVTG